MNQCDINYRQSSNKRLLVELTLIEIAQITQPAEDGVSAGRKPRRLKSLFKTLIQQQKPKTTAPQVAAAKPAVSTKKLSESPSKVNVITSQSGKSSESATSSNSKIPLSGIGFSWSNLGNNDDKPTKGGMNVIPGSINLPTGQNKATDIQFSQADLEYQWMSMCNRMPQKYSGIATRMKNMAPTITEFPTVEVMVDNELIKQEIEEIQGSISKTLQLYLHNNNLKLTVRVAEQKEKIKVLSRKEQFDEIVEKNPALKRLQQVLDLELA
jgi:DNA polymerase-3 subunit gamma/tau